MEIAATHWYIKNRFAAGATETETSTVWNLILSVYFSLEFGYIKTLQAPYIVTSHLLFSSPEKAQENKFLVVRCRAPGNDGERVWQEEREKLNERFVSDFPQDDSGRRLFGIIAMGKAVQFYEWDFYEVKMKVLALHETVNNDPCFYLDRYCQTVVKYLEYIRNNHLSASYGAPMDEPDRVALPDQVIGS